MHKPVIFFFPDLAENFLGFFRGIDFQPESFSLKVIPVEKGENWILHIWVLTKIFWQDDKETFLLA